MTIGTMLFNPFTGKPRHPSDIASDPRGILIWSGEDPLRAAASVNEVRAPLVKFRHGCKWCGKENCAEGCLETGAQQ